MTDETIDGNETVEKATLWVVTELYYPEETSTGYYLTRIAEGLSDAFDVKVVCGQPNYSARGMRAAKHEMRKGVEIFRARGTRLNKNFIPFRMINIATLSFTIFLHSISRFRKGDKIIVVTTPPSLPFISAIAALFRGGSYILLIHDNYPEILVAAKKIREESVIPKLLNFLNLWLYKYASKIIVVGRDMQKLLETKTRGLDIPIATIPNWAELETVRPVDRNQNKMLQDLDLTEKFVFLYAGNMGYPNDIETIVSAAERLKSNLAIHFVFLGSGVKERWLRRVWTEQNLTNITILESRPRSEQIVFLNACDVALVSLVKKMRGVSMPSRTYNILAAGKPILAISEEDTELTMVIGEERVGWAVPPGEPELLYNKILEIYCERENLYQMGIRSQRAAISKYSLESAIHRYRSEIL